MENKLELYSWLFWFNPYQDLWYAIKTDTSIDFFIGNKEKAVYKSHKDRDTLEQMVLLKIN
jgi:hypothetical protein